MAKIAKKFYFSLANFYDREVLINWEYLLIVEYYISKLRPLVKKHPTAACDLVMFY